jgi:hypothetical protein
MNWDVFIGYVVIFAAITAICCIFKLIDIFISLVMDIVHALKYKPEPNRKRRFKNVDEIFILTKAANEFGFTLYDKTNPIEIAELKNRFRNKAKKAHPDLGGNVEDFVRIKKAYDALLPHVI